MTPCAVCKQPIERTGRAYRTCSPACAQMWREVYRYQVDRERTNRNQAATILRRPETYSAAQVKWATKLAGKSVEEVPARALGK